MAETIAIDTGRYQTTRRYADRDHVRCGLERAVMLVGDQVLFMRIPAQPPEKTISYTIPADVSLAWVT